MTEPPRKRGRPSNAEKAAREAAKAAAAAAAPEEQSFLDQVLTKPVEARRPILQPDEEMLRTISELAKLFCTQNEIAAVLGVSQHTLNDWLSKTPLAHEAWEDGLQHAMISLRRKQLALADKNGARRDLPRQELPRPGGRAPHQHDRQQARERDDRGRTPRDRTQGQRQA